MWWKKEQQRMTRVDLATGLYAKADFERQLLLELKAAIVGESQFSVLAVVPRLLPGEGVEDILRAAAGCVRNLIRDDDFAGHLDGDILAVGLPNCDRVNADALAFRMKSELRMCNQRLRNTNWEVGVACLSEHGSTIEELLVTAIDSARNGRRTLASATPTYAIQIPPALGEFGKL
jgi:PleD family two-component response regulator